MTTDRKRVAAYLPDAVHEAFQTFKNERGINSESEALKQILAEYFGVESEVLPTTIERLIDEKLQPYVEQINALQAKVDEFLDQQSPQPPSMSDFFKSAHEKHYQGRLKV